MSYPDWRLKFAEAMDPRFYDLEWLDFQYNMNRLGFWENDGAAIMAQIRTYPTGARDVHGIVAAGGLDRIVELIPHAEAWGREHGAVSASIDSHPAWLKLLKSSGYRVTRQSIEKDL